MHSTMLGSFALAFTVAMQLSPTAANAQSLGVAFESAHGSRESDLGTVSGVRVDITRPIARNYFWHIGAHQLTRRGESFRSPCGDGPSPPGICRPEWLDQQRRLSFGALGAGVTSSAHHPVSVAAYVDALLGETYTNDLGRTTGIGGSAYTVMLGGAIGGELRARLVRTSASTQMLGYLGVTASGTMPRFGGCDHCPAPLRGAYWFTSWFAGVALGRTPK